MPVNPLPPQAYTKETLQKAYTWLLSQGPSVKEIANSQEMLISLYLKAQRDGDAALETPSIQNFKQELKSLAHMMGDLQPNTKNSPINSNGSANSLASQNQTSAMLSNSPSKTSQLNSSELSLLDSQSLSAIADVRLTLNLSSDIEALRALIALGHKHFKKIHQN